MEALQFKLQVFEGPLDLLLHLIAKHKLDINDIEISLLLEQYLDYIAQMKDADLEVTADFLAMAARLVYIKTAALLPRHEEESEKLKQELSGQLIEYQLLKAVAGRLRGMYQSGVFVRKPQKLPRDTQYRLRHEPSALVQAYLMAAGRAKRRLPPPPGWRRRCRRRDSELLWAVRHSGSYPRTSPSLPPVRGKVPYV